MAESDPRGAAVLAAATAERARAGGDLATASLAERASGLAAFHLQDTDVAVRHMRTAIKLSRAVGSVQLTAEARMALAGVLSWRGQPRAALREIEAALAGLSGVEHARALAQQGAILHMLGRLPDAMDRYRAALPALRRAGDQLWTQRVLLNRGIVHAQRQEFTAATDDLRAAELLCEQLDLDLSLGYVHQNLGFVCTRRGDIPSAMAYFDRAQDRFRAHRSQVGTLLSDRAELLLSVRLIAEARQAAAAAVHAFEQEGRGVALPEARLLLAQAALLDGDAPYAAQQARRAQREFTRHERPAWAALARLTLVRCQLDAAPPGTGQPGTGQSGTGQPDEHRGNGHQRLNIGRLVRIVDLLEAGWPEAAVDARLVAAQLALGRGDLGRGRRLLEQAGRHRRRGVATVRARAWYAEAMLRRTDGDRTGARRAARAGLRILDEHVAGLGATDLRAHAAGHRTELAELGLRMALADGRPDLVFEWAELGRASHLAHRPARPPADPVLAQALTELRAAAAEIEELRSADGGGARRMAHLVTQQARLEAQIRDYHRRQRGGDAAAAARPPPVRALADPLGGAVLLEFVQLDGALLVLSVLDGRARLHGLGPLAELARHAESVPFALRQLARHSARASTKAAAAALLARTADNLDRLLLRTVPELGDRPLVIVPTGPLQSMPWSILPSCYGRPVTVAPSASLWLLAAGRSRPNGPVTVAAGPDLAGARAEAIAVAEVYRTAALTGAAATIGAVTTGLDGAAMAHLATHGLVRSDNPLFSSLRLADGPLMVYDLEALSSAPHTVVLAACDTGRPVVRAGDELMGLSATLLRLGTSQLVAPVLSVLDVEAAPLMIEFHRRLDAGAPAAAALAAAQQSAGADTAGLVAAAPFVCLGAG